MASRANKITLRLEHYISAPILAALAFKLSLQPKRRMRLNIEHIQGEKSLEMLSSINTLVRVTSMANNSNPHSLALAAMKPLSIEPDSPWESGIVESFNGKMRDEFLNLEIFYSRKEVAGLLEQ